MIHLTSKCRLYEYLFPCGEVHICKNNHVYYCQGEFGITYVRCKDSFSNESKLKDMNKNLLVEEVTVWT